LVARTRTKVTIIILNWNGKEDTIECVESVRNITYPNYEILIVDNGSTDGSQEVFKLKYPNIILIENQQNLGFAEGNNIGMRYALKRGTDYILLLNNDTMVDKHFLDELIKWAEMDQKVGIAGPKIYFYHEPNKICSLGANINLWTGRILNIGHKQIDKDQFEDIKKVDYVPGAAILVKRKVIEKIGLLDKNYFFYYEETDWCARAKKIGYSVIAVSESKIWHKIGSTAGKIEGFTLYYGTRSHFLFMKKNANKIQFLFFLIFYILIYNMLKTIYVIFKYRNLKSLITYYKGIYDGITSKPASFDGEE